MLIIQNPETVKKVIEATEAVTEEVTEAASTPMGAKIILGVLGIVGLTVLSAVFMAFLEDTGALDKLKCMLVGHKWRSSAHNMWCRRRFCTAERVPPTFEPVPTIVSPPEEIEEPEPNARLAADYEDPPPEQRPEEKKFLDTDQGIFDLEPPTSGYVCFSCGHHMAPGTEVCQECQSIQTDSDEGICPKTNKHWKKSKEEPHKAVFQCKICTQFHLPSPTW